MPQNGYRLFLFLACLITVFSVVAANESNRIDSLQQKIATVKDSMKVGLLNQIAWEYRIYDLQKTDSFSRMAIALSNELGYEKGLGFAYNNLALVERNSGNYKAALEKARWSLLHFVRCGYLPGNASSYNTIASIHHIQGNFAVALLYYLKSYQISESLDDKQGLARSLNNIGSLYMDREEYDKSLNYLRRAYDLQVELGDESALADELINIANIYQFTNKRELAVEYYQKAIELNKKNKNLKGVAAGYNNIGTVYNDLSNPKEALNCFFQALAIDEQIGDVESVILTFNNIASCYINLDMYHSALNYAQRALKLATSYQLKNYMMDSYLLLYKLELAEENYKSALEYHKLYKIYSDSINSQITSDRIALLEKRYLREKEEKEHILEGKEEELNAKLHHEKERQINQYIFTIGLVLLIFVIVIYVVFFVLKWQKEG